MGLEVITAATGVFASMTGIPQHFEQKKAGRRAARAQEKANQTSQSAAQIENARRRRQAIAQARIARAQNEASVGSEVASSSALTGVQSGLSTQLGANIAAQQQRINAQNTVMGFQQQSADALRRGQERVGLWNAAAQTGNAVLSLGTSIAGGPSGGVGGTSGANSFASQTPGPRGAGGFR